MDSLRGPGGLQATPPSHWIATLPSIRWVVRAACKPPLYRI